MAKVGYVGNTPNSSSVIIARQIYNVSDTVGLVTFTSTYQPGYVDVYLNGVRLVEVVDYSAADGTHINLSTDAVVGDVIEAVSYKAFNVTDKRIGISSDGILIGTVDALNFVGAGHTFVTNGSSINCSITGPQGIPGVGRTWATYDGLTGVTTSKKVRIQNNLEVTGIATAGVLFSGNLTGTAVTATTFVGALTGNSTGLTGSPNITVGTVGCGNVTSTGSITGATGSFSGNVTIGGVLTYEDVTNIDAIGIITAQSGVSIADSIFHTGDSNTAIRFPANDTFTVETDGSETARFTSSAITFKAPDGGSRYNFGELGNSAHAELSLYNSSDSQKVRIAANNDTFFNGGNVIVNGTTTGSSAKFEVRSTTGSISSATLRLNGDATDTGAINTGSSLLFAGHDGGNASRDFASIFAGKENGTGSNYAAYLAFGTRANGSSMAEKLRITSAGDLLIGLTAAVGEGGTPADLNSTEIGRGFINLSRDDTAAADHILFGKNGAIAASVGTDTTNTLVFKTGTTERLRIDSSGNSTFTGTVDDSKGDVRDIPQSSNSSARTLVATDGGKVVMTSSGGWVIPTGVMSQGNTVTLLNGDGSDQTINATALNALYNTADGTNIKASTITLGGASMATIWFGSGTFAYISATNMTVS